MSRDVRSRLWLVVEPRACGGSAEAWFTDALVVEKLMSEGKLAVGVDQPLSPWSSVTTFPLMNVTSNDKGHVVEAVVSRATEAACAFWTKRGTGGNKGKGEGEGGAGWGRRRRGRDPGPSPPCVHAHAFCPCQGPPSRLVVTRFLIFQSDIRALFAYHSDLSLSHSLSVCVCVCALCY